MASVTVLLCSLQKLPSKGGECTSINMSIFCVPFHTTAVKLHLTFVSVTSLQFNFMSKILQHPFLFGPTGQQQFIALVCKLSDEDENNCPRTTCVAHFHSLH